MIQWQGIDGTILPTAARTDLCLHQWPEDFAGLFDSPLLGQVAQPAIVQWLELMPSKDWMCRSELLLPNLKALLGRTDFDVQPVTLSGLLAAVGTKHAPIRRYTMDDVWHGMSLGKNFDYMRRLSRRAEMQLLAAETTSAVAGLFGRPYPSWDVYPVWELEESWRDLLAAQHHDNDECEGLCGFVGERSYERSLGLSGHVLQRTLQHLADRADVPRGHVLVFNPLGWARDVVIPDPSGDRMLRAKHVPAFGFTTIDPTHAPVLPYGAAEVREEPDAVTLARADLEIRVDRRRGVITQLRSSEFPAGMLDDDHVLADLRMVRDGVTETFPDVDFTVDDDRGRPVIVIERRGRDGARVTVRVSCADLQEAAEVEFHAENLPAPDGRMHAALTATVSPALKSFEMLHDTPYAIGPVTAEHNRVRKYPKGDWMTSPQVFETVERSFIGLHLVDLHHDGHGLLVVHDGNQAFFRQGDHVTQILTLKDPWDEKFFRGEVHARVAFVPHGRMHHVERWKMAMQFNAPILTAVSQRDGGDVPASFGPFHDDASGVIATAFYRESETAGQNLDGWAGRGMGHPYVVRLVEFNGRHASPVVTLPGPITKAFRTNLMGETVAPLDAWTTKVSHPPLALEWSAVKLELRPHEITTLMVDLELGRKVARDLDAHRSVWATVHREGKA